MTDNKVIRVNFSPKTGPPDEADYYDDEPLCLITCAQCGGNMFKFLSKDDAMAMKNAA